LTFRKYTFAIYINSLQINANNAYRKELFCGWKARLAEKIELSGHLSPFDTGLLQNCSLQPSKSHNSLKIAASHCFTEKICHLEILGDWLLPP